MKKEKEEEEEKVPVTSDKALQDSNFVLSFPK